MRADRSRTTAAGDMAVVHSMVPFRAKDLCQMTDCDRRNARHGERLFAEN